MPPAADIATAMAASRSRLSQNHLPKEHPLKAFPPGILVISFIARQLLAHTGVLTAAAGRRARPHQGMLTIPPIASSFAAPAERSRPRREPKSLQRKGELDGGCR
jgi:hypothetical protein